MYHRVRYCTAEGKGCFMKLVVSDTDGTVLMRGEREIGRVASEAIDYVLNSGAAFAVASGRSFGELKRIFKRWEDKIYFIASDGALTVHGGETLFEFPISDFSSDCFAAHGKYMTFLKAKSLQLVRAHLKHYENHVMQIDDLSEADAPIYKITDFSRREKPSGGAEELFKVYESRDMTEYVAKGVNKGTALLLLSEFLGIPKEEILAFGDGKNDVEMFSRAGLACAVGNAPPEIKRKADRVADFNVTVLEGLI